MRILKKEKIDSNWHRIVTIRRFKRKWIAKIYKKYYEMKGYEVQEIDE